MKSIILFYRELRSPVRLIRHSPVFFFSAGSRALYLVAFCITLIIFTIAGLFAKKMLFADCKVKFVALHVLKMIFPVSRFNALIYQWAIRLTTILFAGLGIAILPILAEGYGTIKIAFTISEIAILHPSLLVIF